MNVSASRGLPPSRERGTWFRAISAQYLVTPLAVIHTKAIASRFSAGYLLNPADQFAILYLTEDPQTALYEFGAMLGTPLVAGRAVPNPRPTPVILNVSVDLQYVADLAQPASQTTLATSAQELTGDWAGYQHRKPGITSVPGPNGVAPTQELGLALFRSGFEGFRTVSARVSTAHNLVVFPGNMRAGSRIEFRHPDPAIGLFILAP